MKHSDGLREQTSKHALIVGASGGIGGALLASITSRGLAGRVSAWSRRPIVSQTPIERSVAWSAVDLRDEQSIVDAASDLGEVDLVVVATGILHATAAGSHRSMQPEKSWRAIDPEMMAESFAVNTIGPALVAKHVLPLFPRDRRAVFAAMSARVGSIGDNRLGGWYSYRAAKSALNQIIRTLSIELAAKRPHAICVGLHPGTVASDLSQPFQRNVPAGKLSTPEESAAQLLAVISGLSPGDSGNVFDTKGFRVPD